MIYNLTFEIKKDDSDDIISVIKCTHIEATEDNELDRDIYVITEIDRRSNIDVEKLINMFIESMGISNSTVSISLNCCEKII